MCYFIYLILLIGLPKLTYVTSSVFVHTFVFLIFCNISSGISKIFLQVYQTYKLFFLNLSMKHRCIIFIFRRIVRAWKLCPMVTLLLYLIFFFWLKNFASLFLIWHDVTWFSLFSNRLSWHTLDLAKWRDIFFHAQNVSVKIGKPIQW